MDQSKKMSQKYSLEYFLNASPETMAKFYQYYGLAFSNLDELFRILEKNGLLVESDIPYIKALAKDPYREILKAPGSKIPGRTLSDKAATFRRIIDSSNTSLAKIPLPQFSPETFQTMSQQFPVSLGDVGLGPSRNQVFSAPSMTQNQIVPFQVSSVPSVTLNKIPTSQGFSPPLPTLNQGSSFQGFPPILSSKSQELSTLSPILNQGFSPILPSKSQELSTLSPILNQVPAPQLSMSLETPAYTMLNVNVNVRSLSEVMAMNETPIQRYTITYNEFLAVMTTSEYIDKFIASLTQLYKSKREFYTSKIGEYQREIQDIRREFDEIKRMDSTARMSDSFPQYKTLLQVSVEARDLVGLIDGHLVVRFDRQGIIRGFNNAIYDRNYGLNSIVGRSNIKDYIVRILYSFANDYRIFNQMFNNFAIYGPAGVGKTRMGNIIGFIFNQTKILIKGTFNVVTRADLVSSWVGMTAPQTRSILLRSLEGVLFIDEAYELPPAPNANRDHGMESITELVNFLDKYIGKNIVIVAGYRIPMEERFMTSNEGLPRRFPNILILEPYSNEELTSILYKNLTEQSNLLIDPSTASYLYTLVTVIGNQSPVAFKNQAGDMLNLASFLLRNIQSSYHHPWINGNLENNTPLILSGFNDFLMSKNLQITAPQG